MPRILVADDNSNIQKMVALALQDQGVEVIGVGNGEAAVRKVPEIHPDVILADVFMPVRSGYEVCEFVKNDSRYMHTPVVLLVGAFDPLDEQEAQRVRADGVLKKPFVPPEPLVNLVKALLVKSASERLVAVAVPAESASATAEAAPAKPAPRTHAEEFADEPAEEFSVPAPRLKVGEYDAPVAFGSLLETPAEELPALDETDPIVTAARDPNLGEPAFWVRPPQAEAEQPVADDVEAMDHSWGHSESLPGMDESAVMDPIEPIELDHEAARVRSLEIPPEEELSVAPSQDATTAPAEKREEPALEELVTVTEAAAPELDVAPAPTVLIDWPSPQDTAPLPLPQAAAVTADPPVTAGADPELERPIGSETPVVSTSVDPILESTAEQAAELQAGWRPELEPAVEAEVQTEVAAEAEWDVAESVPAPFDVRVQEEEDVESSWPPPFRPVVTPSEAVKSSAPAKSASPWPPIERNVPAAPAAAASIPHATEPPAPLPAAVEAMAPDAPAMTKSAVGDARIPSSLDPEMIEAVVSRIVERMQPKVIDMVTREILRPVVEALVRREMGKK